ncbi:MAG: hypothetical protein VB853_10425 [Pirellulales bacterium]
MSRRGLIVFAGRAGEVIFPRLLVAALDGSRMHIDQVLNTEAAVDEVFDFLHAKAVKARGEFKIATFDCSAEQSADAID